MKIGVPKERKDHEYRVGLNPDSVAELCHHGHDVLVEHDAGHGIGATDDDYRRAGATIVADGESVFATARLIVKVKEPLAEERQRLRPDHILFTYLHLAADSKQTEDLLASGATCIAYETVTDSGGGLPLLAPMSAIAGRLASQVGAYYLQKSQGGSGKLPGGVPGVEAANVVIVGGGTVGQNAALIANGLQAQVTVIDKSPQVLRQIASRFDGRVGTIHATHRTLKQWVPRADLLIGSVLQPGARAPKLVTREMIAAMRPGSVAVDVAIDQGGCFETSRPTTHSTPIFVSEGVLHYCVTNMPGAVPTTATAALNNATLPFVLALADHGLDALRDDPGLRNGLNILAGTITHCAVAKAQQRPCTPPEELLTATGNG